jgi:hypothetical protein
MTTLVWTLLSNIFFAAPALADRIGNAAQAMTPRSGLLVPLYIYPVPGAWDPLYQA